MLEVHADRPVDPVVCEILSLLNATLSNEAIKYFLVGATARDLLMYHVFGVKSGRATKDVDFAVALENWEQFERVNTQLVMTGRFTKGAAAQRLFFDTDKHQAGYPIDIVPFGDVEQKDGHIAWPPEGHVIMNVAGYEESFQAASPVQVTSDIVTKAVSVPALAGLKLMAWKDRSNETTRDAQDLLFLLRNYTKAGNVDRLYEETPILLQSCNFDIDLAGAGLLGFDCRIIMGQDVVRTMLSIVEDQRLRDKLVLHMARDPMESSKQTNTYLQMFEHGLRAQTLE